MKVGTDAVLLGSWAMAGPRILDIGTGTGILALMLAQRYPQAQVQAIELDPAAAQQARENFAASPFAERLQLWEGAVQAFPTQAFEAIVCNPPYFGHNQQIGQTARRWARQDAQLTFQRLAQELRRLLASKGRVSLVLPTERFAAFQKAAEAEGFYLRRLLEMHTRPQKPVKRLLMEWRKEAGPLEKKALVLHEGEGYSPTFQELTNAFYLQK